MIRRASLVLFNVLCCTNTLLPNDRWLEKTEELKQLAVRQGLYPVSLPVIRTDAALSKTNTKTCHFYLPLNGILNMDGEGNVSFRDALIIGSTLMLSHFEEEKLFSASYRELKDYAGCHGLKLSSRRYHVMREISGEWITEIHIPIENEKLRRENSEVQSNIGKKVPENLSKIV
ncbi:hypothetical protein QS257_02525 [Terrilactibacillus sp. S3-3]|nr:hypothetical protein QS257_02525 [Terrilactibacillus sp. S3-3]